jgi:DNA polymerase I-like protein with 3'-5' exonuclease and polymerase domains
MSKRLPPRLSSELCVTTTRVAELANSIKKAGPGARICYDTETGCSPELDAAFKGEGALFPYAGAYLTGFSCCIVLPSTFMDMSPLLKGYYVPLGHSNGPNVTVQARRALAEGLGQTEATHVLHNSPFDWAFMLNEGLLYDVPRKAEDTQVKRWLQDENGTKKLKLLGELWCDEDASAEQRHLHSLMAAPYSKITDARKAVLIAYPELAATLKSGKPSTAKLAEEGEHMAQELRRGKGWGELTVEDLFEYAARDATLTAEIDHLLDGYSPKATIEREMKVNAICVDMTRKGVSIDVDKLHSASAMYRARQAELGKELLEVHGLENPGSKDQVADLLFNRLGLPIRGRTKTGAPSTDKNALEQLAGDPVAGKVLEWRKWDKACSAYAEPFIRFAEHSADGRVHGMYGTTRTVTGRLAASGPNVMTIPREDSLPEVRRAFNLDPSAGTERLGFDLASAELWVTASVTGDPMLTQCLLEGRNLHIETMLAIFGGEPDKHRREYTLSKNGNYGVEYGAGIDQLTIYAAKSGCSPAEARRVAEKFHAGHKRTFAKQHKMAAWWADQAQTLGKLPIWADGRYRHFKSPGKAIKYYTALNALVQGGVAEFMKDTMIELYRRGYGELLILQVHDELVFDVPAGKGMEKELVGVLNRISQEINPFKYALTWEPKAWSI